MTLRHPNVLSYNFLSPGVSDSGILEERRLVTQQSLLPALVLSASVLEE